MSVLGTSEVAKSSSFLETYHETLGKMLPELEPVDAGNTRFFDCFSMHGIKELWMLSRLCHAHMPERIVEYGTAMAGLTRLFGRWAHVSGAKVLTIENKEYSQMGLLPECFKETMAGLPIEFYEGCEYTQETYEHIQTFVSGKRTMFYCDGGNKAQEIQWCAALLTPDDLLLSHDYAMTEEEQKTITLHPLLAEVGHVTERQVQRILKKFNLEIVFEDQLGAQAEGEERLTHILALRKER